MFSATLISVSDIIIPSPLSFGDLTARVHPKYSFLFVSSFINSSTTQNESPFPLGTYKFIGVATSQTDDPSGISYFDSIYVIRGLPTFANAPFLTRLIESSCF